MTQRQTGQDKLDALTSESSGIDMVDALVTRVDDAFQTCVSNLPTSRKFLDQEGVENDGQLDDDGKRRHREFLLQEMEKAVETGYLKDLGLDSADQLSPAQTEELAERTKAELAKWQR